MTSAGRSRSRSFGMRLWGEGANENMLPPPVRLVGPLDALTPGLSQEPIWFFDRLAAGEPVCNSAEAFQIEGGLDAAALETALQQIVDRHDSLRTSFFERDGRPLMCVTDHLKFAIEHFDLRGGTSDQIRAVCRTQTRRLFDLSQAPLLRVGLLHLAGRSHIILFVVHHIIQDGATRGVLYDELSQRYDALAQGRTTSFAPLPFRFADFAAWQRTVLDGRALDKQRRFWHAAFATPPPPLELAAARPRSAIKSYRGGQFEILVPLGDFEPLKALACAHDASMFMTLMAAFSVLLHRYTGLNDIVLGFPTAGRVCAETAGMMGCFINNLALRSDLSGDPTFREFLERTRAALLAAYDNQDFPFKMLVEELQPARSLNRTPLFSVMAQLVDRRRATLAFAGLRVVPVAVDAIDSVLDLSLDMREVTDGLECRFVYKRDLFDEATIGRLGANFRTLIAGIAAEPDRAVSHFPLLDAEERRAEPKLAIFAHRS